MHTTSEISHELLFIRGNIQHKIMVFGKNDLWKYDPVIRIALRIQI